LGEQKVKHENIRLEQQDLSYGVGSISDVTNNDKTY